jgi:hypothetical protein
MVAVSARQVIGTVGTALMRAALSTALGELGGDARLRSVGVQDALVVALVGAPLAVCSAR